MRIHIKTTDLELTKPLAEYIKKKIGGLGRFIKKLKKKGEVKIFFEIERTNMNKKNKTKTTHGMERWSKEKKKPIE